jgi:hypothetical protein
MGYGARHNAIENKVDHLNWEKNIGQGTYSCFPVNGLADRMWVGDTLARKLIVAIAERDKQVSGFKEVNRTIVEEMRAKWQKRIDDWLADKSKPNPYWLEGGKSGKYLVVDRTESYD